MPERRPPSAGIGPRVRPLPVSRRRPRPPFLGAALALGAVAAGLAALVLVRGVDPEAAPLQPAAQSRAQPPPPSLPELPAPPAPPAPVAARVPAPEPLPAAVPARPALTVLNNSRVPALAARSARHYRDGGWPVAVVGNFRGRIARTTVYYEPGQQGPAEALAAEFGVPRVLPRFAGLPGRGLTVVVTRDLA